MALPRLHPSLFYVNISQIIFLQDLIIQFLGFNLEFYFRSFNFKFVSSRFLNIFHTKTIDRSFVEFCFPARKYSSAQEQVILAHRQTVPVVYRIPRLREREQRARGRERGLL